MSQTIYIYQGRIEDMKLGGRRVTLLGKKKQPKKGFLGGGTPLPESAPVDSHVLMRHIYRIWVQN
jgi:hypothetical protein